MYPHGPQGHRIEVCHDILVRAGRMPSPPRRVESRQPTEAEVRRAEEALEAERERDRAFRAAEERFELFRTQLDAAQTPQAAAEVLRAVVQANIAEASYLPYQLAGVAAIWWRSRADSRPCRPRRPGRRRWSHPISCAFGAGVSREGAAPCPGLRNAGAPPRQVNRLPYPNGLGAGPAAVSRWDPARGFHRPRS